MATISSAACLQDLVDGRQHDWPSRLLFPHDDGPVAHPLVNQFHASDDPGTPLTDILPKLMRTALVRRVTSTARGGVYIVRAPKRVRPAANGFGGPNGYVTHGLRDSPLHSHEGRKLVAAYTSQGMAPDRALKMSRELMASGSALPKAVDLAAGASLFKIVPEGDMPGPHSAFFATKDEVTALKRMSVDQIADRLGIPLECQQSLRFDVVKVKAIKAVTVFESIIAPTTQNGYIQPGGGIQTLITDRRAFTSPVQIGKFS
jgi:hypothetical protein